MNRFGVHKTLGGGTAGQMPQTGISVPCGIMLSNDNGEEGTEGVNLPWLENWMGIIPCQGGG